MLIIDSKKLYPWKGPDVGGAYGYYRVMDLRHVLLYDYDRHVKALVWRDGYRWGQPIGGSDIIVTACLDNNRIRYMYGRTHQTDYWLGISTESDMRNLASYILSHVPPLKK